MNRKLAFIFLPLLRFFNQLPRKYICHRNSSYFVTQMLRIACSEGTVLWSTFQRPPVWYKSLICRKYEKNVMTHDFDLNKINNSSLAINSVQTLWRWGLMGKEKQDLRALQKYEFLPFGTRVWNSSKKNLNKRFKNVHWITDRMMHEPNWEGKKTASNVTTGLLYLSGSIRHSRI